MDAITDKNLRPRASIAVASLAWLVACAGLRAPSGANEPSSSGALGGGSCAGLEKASCRRAQGLIAASTAFGNVRHEYLLDASSSMAPGRGVQRFLGKADYSVLPTRCAQERNGVVAQDKTLSVRVDASTIDFTYVGVTVDQQLVSADADLTAFVPVSAGAEASSRKISLVALAFVRDLDPQFFGASDDVVLTREGCACGRATHFIGAVKMGGMLSFEMTVRASELHGGALAFFKARLSASDARITQTVVGGLEIDGLDSTFGKSASGAPKPLTFAVKNPVPIAYALYPLDDVCKFSFPAPELAPEVLDFGEVPYGREATRLLHVVNRASIDLVATLGARSFSIPALASIDLPMTWKPEGETLGCEPLTRDETVQFVPRDADVRVTPRAQSLHVSAHALTGKPTFRRHEHVDTGVHRKPDYAATERAWECPPGYAVSGCRTEKTECGDGTCTTDGYAVNAEPTANGCRFRCGGPEGLFPGLSSMFCRFDAVMDCRLRCR